jgi:predicted esterase
MTVCSVLGATGPSAQAKTGPSAQAKAGPSAQAKTGPSAQAKTAAAAHRPEGLPAGAAVAALRSEPSLPVPTGWGFPTAFSRTSGTGRLIGGALEWTDWIDDAYGASSPEGAPINSITLNGPLSPANGDYVYAAGSAGNDGADIFRAAVGLTRTATIWRIDWNTLADPSIPIAEWTFDTDDNASTGASEWPAGANVGSPGIERALVVSAKGAELINAVTDRTIATIHTTVDRSSQSFLVRIPRKLMPVSRRWRIRLAAGLDDAAGNGFAVPTLTGGAAAPSSAPRIYNITFRTAAQEPPIFTDGQTDAQVARLRAYLADTPLLGAYGGDGATALVTGNFWGEDDQANTLATGDVSKFSQVINWAALAARKRTAPPLVKGYSERWYRTDLHLGQGMDDTEDANPTYLERVQPYAVYIPSNYTGRRALPLTWLLHSLDGNYNQYGGIDPRQVQEECQDRDSICVSPEGFGPDGGWAGDAEHDFWQVWRQMALGYKIAPDRSVISGYSMGGIGTFIIGATYPSDFSEGMALDGLTDSGCSNVDRAANDHWVPYVISNAEIDELSPYTDAVEEEQDFQGAGNRFDLFTTSLPEHNATAASDGFSTQIAALGGTPEAMVSPGTINYTWCPAVVDSALGLGPTSVYWLSGFSERSASASDAQVVVIDGAIPTPSETLSTNTTSVVPPDAPPMLKTTGAWNAGTTPAPNATLSMKLTNVAALSFDTVAARLPHGSATIDSDGVTALTLTRLKPGTAVTAPGGGAETGSAGTVTVNLPDGTSIVSW